MTHIQALQFETVWKEIEKTLKPLGMMPDKASLDYNQILALHLTLEKSGNVLRDCAQVSILRKELSCIVLNNLVN